MAFDLAQALAAAQPVIDLPPGDYGDVVIRGRKGLKLRGDGATCRTLQIDQCQDVEIAGLVAEWTPDAKAGKDSNVVRIGGGSKNIRVVGCGSRGLPLQVATTQKGMGIGRAGGRGLTIHENASFVEVEDFETTGFFCGPVLAGCADVTFTRLHSHDQRTTHVRGSDVVNLTLDRCRLVGNDPWEEAGDHWDHLHIWREAGGPMGKIVILDCLFEQGAGKAGLSVKLQDKDGRGFPDVQVKRLTVINGDTCGFDANNASGSLEDCVFLAPPGTEAKRYPTLDVDPARFTVKGCTFHERSIKPSWASQLPGNTILSRAPASAEQVEAARAVALERIWPVDWKGRALEAEARIEWVKGWAGELQGRLG